MRILFNRFWKAVLIGMANVIPGVSGGTMAVVTGLYEELVGAVGNLVRPKLWLAQVPVLGPVTLGVAVGIAGFSRLILWLLSVAPEPTGLFFAALVAAGFPLLWTLFRAQSPGPRSWMALVVSFLLVASLAFVAAPSKESVSVVADRSWVALLGFALAGATATGAMVVPGISGSFILLMIGLYTTVFTAVNDLDLSVLAPFGVGAVLGLYLASRTMSFLFEKLPGIAYGTVFGLVAGSLFPLVQKAIAEQSHAISVTHLGAWLWVANALAVVLGLVGGTLLGKRPQQDRKTD